jgi:hypothetical protein
MWLGQGMIPLYLLSRYYNQPYKDKKGLLYSSGTDAIRKIVQAEGPSALYKGLITHFFRIGPHFCLTFLFLGILRRHWNAYYELLDRRDSFNEFDRDGDGRLDRDEVGGLVACVLGVDGDEKKV